MFSQYPPSAWWSYAIYGEFDTPYVSTSSVNYIIEQEPIAVLDVDSSMSLITPAKADSYGLREVVHGVTETNEINVFGFPSQWIVRKRGISLDQVDSECALLHKALSMGAGVRSGRPYLAQDLTDSIRYDQIILREQDYTQAMADADNLLSYSLGGNDVTVKVVGIWKELTP
jgi:hypothetical protein